MQFLKPLAISCGLLIAVRCVPEDPEIIESREFLEYNLQDDPNEVPSQGACPKCLEVEILSADPKTTRLVLTNSIVNREWRAMLDLADEATLTVVTADGVRHGHDIRTLSEQDGHLGFDVSIPDDACAWTIHLDLKYCIATDDPPLPDGSYIEICRPRQTYVRVLGCDDADADAL